jgi:hypothetical protein
MAKVSSTPSTSARSDVSDEDFRIPVSWYDGTTALRREGTASWSGDRLLLDEDGGVRYAVPFADLHFVETLPDERVYGRHSVPDFRLRLPLALPPGIERHLPRPSHYGGWVDRLGLGKAVVIFGIASAAAVALFMTAPEWLGPRIPETFEARIGEAMVGNFGNRLCSTPQGDAALAKLLDAVDPSDRQVRAGIANIDMVNAVALPGGQVMLFDGLVQQAESPAELAGVLGHEVGHVRERHVMTALLRQFGLSILLSGANSGLGDTVFGLAAMGYTRDAEREADEFARMQMARSNVSPLGAARFFERLAEESGADEDADSESGPDIAGWIASHPSPGARARAYRTAATAGADYDPILTPAEFENLKGMCEADPDVEEFEFF